MTINKIKKLATLFVLCSFSAQANFVDSPEANDEKLLEIIKNFSEANCQNVADDACAKLFLEAVASDPENEDYKYYNKKRKKLITTYNKYNEPVEEVAQPDAEQADVVVEEEVEVEEVSVEIDQ